MWALPCQKHSDCQRKLGTACRNLCWTVLAKWRWYKLSGHDNILCVYVPLADKWFCCSNKQMKVEQFICFAFGFLSVIFSRGICLVLLPAAKTGPQRGQCLQPSLFRRLALSIKFLFCLLLAIEAWLCERSKTAPNLMEYVIRDNWEKAVSEQNKNILAVGALKWQSLPPHRQALSRDHFTVIAVLRKERRLPFLTYSFPCSLPDTVWESDWCVLTPAPLAGCQPLVSRAAASISNQAEPWEKLCPLPQRISILSDGLSSALECGSVTCP